jgi:uncharacterized protein (DUF1697 family)
VSGLLVAPGTEESERKMDTFVALLRGVNIGHKQVTMAELRRGLEATGLHNVKTYLQSGNVVFDAEGGDAGALAAAIRAHVAADFGHDVDVLVLSCDELARIASSNPFLTVPGADQRWLHATFLLQPSSAVHFETLALPVVEGERAALIERVVFLYLPHGYGRTKLSNALFERVLRTPATTRNWRTVLALSAMCVAR